MKRALAVLLAFVGFSAFGIGTFSGKWETSLCYPPFAVSTKLTLNYSDFGWTFTSVSMFGNEGYVYQKFGASGAFGPFSIKSNMWFDPANVAYMASDLSTSLDFAGLSLSFTARHWANGYWSCDGAYKYGPDKAWYPDTNPCCDEPQTNPGLQYILKATVDPITIKLRFKDCCTGTEFQDLLITLKGIGLCCGIALDGALFFTKDGFQYVEFSGIEIPLCCGVSLTAKVKFAVGAKTVTTGLKFAGIGDTCFTVYAVPVQSPSTNPTQWLGLELKGFAINCTLGDCNYVKFVTAFDPAWYNSNVENVFLTSKTCGNTVCDLQEYEYVKLGFCGPGCCGGQYKVSISTFFGKGNDAGLFDITRLAGSMSIPVMANFTFDVSFSVFAKCACPAVICAGWTFTF